MAKFEKFEDIEAWRKARALNVKIYKITVKTAFSKDFALTNQIRKASISIMANIAEGFGRKSNKEFINFLNIAHGSIAEIQSHLYTSLDLEYINEEDFGILYREADKISKMIQNLMNYLKKYNSRTPKLLNM